MMVQALAIMIASLILALSGIHHSSDTQPCGSVPYDVSRYSA
jgi:hypothetical protein